MSNTPGNNEETTRETGVFGSAWIDFKNLVTGKSRAGKARFKALIVFSLPFLFSIAVALVNFGLFSSRFWEAFFSQLVLALVFLLWILLVSYLGMVAKHLRRALWPNSFKAAAEMEDYFEGECVDEAREEGEAERPMTEEEWEFYRKL